MKKRLTHLEFTYCLGYTPIIEVAALAAGRRDLALDSAGQECTMTIGIQCVCAMSLLLVAGSGFAAEQDYKAKRADTLKKRNALIENGNKIIPAKIADKWKKLADAQGLPDELFLAYLKAGGFFEPKFDGTQPSVVPDITNLPEKDRALVATKYMLAEGALAWRAVDPKFEYFLSPKERDPVEIKLHRTALESAIEVLEYAKGRPVFAGLEYAAGGPDVIDELKFVLKRLPM